MLLQGCEAAADILLLEHKLQNMYVTGVSTKKLTKQKGARRRLLESQLLKFFRWIVQGQALDADDMHTDGLVDHGPLLALQTDWKEVQSETVSQAADELTRTGALCCRCRLEGVCAVIRTACLRASTG